MRTIIYKKAQKAGSRTYHISVNKTVYDKIYLKISQVKKDENDSLKKISILVFEEDISAFVETFKEAIEVIANAKESQDALGSKIGYQKIRLVHNRAYYKWSEEEDIQLKENLSNGMKRSELSKLLGRSKGSIQARIEKLELDYK